MTKPNPTPTPTAPVPPPNGSGEVAVMADKKPLWEVMQASSRAAKVLPPDYGRFTGDYYAAMLRAIADEVWKTGKEGQVVDFGDICNWLMDAANEAEGKS